MLRLVFCVLGSEVTDALIKGMNAVGKRLLLEALYD